MERKRAEELYGQILQCAQQIRTEIMTESADTISFGGQMTLEDATELQNAARITGCAFDALVKRGVPTEAVEGKPDLVRIKVSAGTFVCNLNAMGIHENQTPVVKTNIMPAPVKEVIYASETPVAKPENIPEESAVKTVPVTEKPVETSAEEPVTEEKKSLGFAPIPIEDEEEEPVETSLQKEETAELPKETPKATIIGEMPVETEKKSDFDFKDDKRKHQDMFIFDSYRISAAHIGSMGNEEMTVMIAPLINYAGPNFSVPILVSICYRGRMYSKSTYDCEAGKTMVRSDVSDFSFLCRGEYKEDGKFYSTIVTTGPSADNGDILTVMSLEKYGTAFNTGNNHIKFHYTSEKPNDGMVEVFPMEPGADEFIIISRTEEYVDYFYLARGSRTNGIGLSKVTIFDENVKKELVINWDREVLEAELVEG